MALIKIKQINNAPASAGDVITYNGTNNVWAPIPAAGGLTVVTAFASLPVSPSTDDIVVYTPFNSIMRFDGTVWVGPKFSTALFGREGTGNNSTWLQAIGRSSAFPTSGVTHGYIIPSITDGSGTSDWKIYNMSVTSRTAVSGDMELHADSTATTPTFGATGIAAVTLTAQTALTADVTPAVVNGGQILQCFWNRTSSQWRDWTVIVTYSMVAAA